MVCEEEVRTLNNLFILKSLIDNQLLLLFLQVFNLFFVKEHEKKHVVHCLRCARHLNKDLTGWICLGAFPRSDMSDDYLSNLFCFRGIWYWGSMHNLWQLCAGKHKSRGNAGEPLQACHHEQHLEEGPRQDGGQGGGRSCVMLTWGWH